MKELNLILIDGSEVNFSFRDDFEFLNDFQGEMKNSIENGVFWFLSKWQDVEAKLNNKNIHYLNCRLVVAEHF